MAAFAAVKPNIFCIYLGRKVASDMVTSPLVADDSVMQIKAGFCKSLRAALGNSLNFIASPVCLTGDILSSACASDILVSRTRLAAINTKKKKKKKKSQTNKIYSKTLTTQKPMAGLPWPITKTCLVKYTENFTTQK